MRSGFKKSAYLYLSLLFVIIIVLSCKYEPVENFKRELNKDVPPPEINISGFNYSSDTIYLLSDTILNLRFTSSIAIEELVFFINDNSTSLTFFEDGHGEGYKKGPTSGVHKLTIELYTGTGTNSIADKSGTEAYKFSKTWYIFVNGKVESEYFATFNNGIAILKWDVYKY